MAALSDDGVEAIRNAMRDGQYGVPSYLTYYNYVNDLLDTVDELRAKLAEKQESDDGRSQREDAD